MKPFKSTIIIFDTEFIMYKPNKLDLLEIGAIALDCNGDILDKFFIKCIPTRYPYDKKVRNHLEKIQYNSDPEYYSSGVSYDFGLYRFFKWSMAYKQVLFCSWSNYDHIVFDNIINVIKTKDKAFKHDKINMFDLQRSYMNLFNLNQQPSLQKVLEEHNIIPNETLKLHNALNDALYTSRLLLIYFDHFSSEMRKQTKNSFRTIKTYK
jgi:inhibitor of KinA sporulation pathway (predicted exonuclease)